MQEIASQFGALNLSISVERLVLANCLHWLDCWIVLEDTQVRSCKMREANVLVCAMYDKCIFLQQAKFNSSFRHHSPKTEDIGHCLGREPDEAMSGNSSFLICRRHSCIRMQDKAFIHIMNTEGCRRSRLKTGCQVEPSLSSCRSHTTRWRVRHSRTEQHAADSSIRGQMSLLRHRRFGLPLVLEQGPAQRPWTQV